MPDQRSSARSRQEEDPCLSERSAEGLASLELQHFNIGGRSLADLGLARPPSHQAKMHVGQRAGSGQDTIDAAAAIQSSAKEHYIVFHRGRRVGIQVDARTIHRRSPGRHAAHSRGLIRSRNR